MFLVRVAKWFVSIVWLLPSGNLLAQVQNEFDFDTTQLVVTTIPPNGATHTITTQVTYTGQNLALNAPLTVRAGAELRLVRCVLKVSGTITVEDGGRLKVIDSSLLLPNQFQRQYEFRIEGGLLHTERALIGSTHFGALLHTTRILLLRGTWLARQTVMQATSAILSDGRTGWFGDPRYKGGSVFADGLYEGERADYVHMGGMGDGVLANGAANVAFYYDAGITTQPSAVTLDLLSRSPLTIVYGDPGRHAGVTAPITQSSHRLELRNHRVPSWALFAVGASSGGPLQTITLRNAEDIICSYHGTDLVGSPVLGGPWASYYSDLPGLPSTVRPGRHALPPGCSVRLGNVVYQSGPGANDWNRIRFWGLYSIGNATNLVVSGPSAIAELYLDNGQIQLIGTGSYDMGVMASTVRIYGTASLQLTNVAIGEFGTGSTLTALIEANDSSSCTITGARTAPLRLRTTNGAAAITAQGLFGQQNVIVDNAGGGSIQINQAAPTQNTDLQNLGFESALLAGNVPPYWAAQSVTGSLVADPAPGAPGANSYALVAQAANASLHKQLALPPETIVSVVGAAKVIQAPGGGATLRLETANGAAVATKLVDPLLLNGWQRVHVPVLTTAIGGAPTFVRFVAGGLPATVRLDDIRVHIGSWWDNDNLGNLGFEWGCRFQGLAPTFWSAPDAWRSFQVRCVSDPGMVRPGALPGSRSIHMTLQASLGSIQKDLTFLRSGDTIVVRGWLRATTVVYGRGVVIVGDGATFYVPGLGNNTQVGPIAGDGTWRQWQVTYVVPANPTYTRIDLGYYDAAGSQCWYDDVTVEIQ